MTNEESPDGQVEGFEITPTPEKENEMNTQDTTAPEYTATDIALALDAIAAGEKIGCPCIDLEPSDALWQEILDVRIKPASELRGYALGELVSLAPLFDTSGRRVEQPADGWWAASEADVPGDVRRYWKQTPNAAIRLGGLLAISHGTYFVEALRTVDGVEVVELVNIEEQKRRYRAERDAYLVAHPEIVAAKPEWASKVTVDAFDEDGADVIFDREFGRLDLSRGARFENGVLTFDGDTMAPSVYIYEREDLTVEGMRELASALLAAIPFAEDAQVQL